MSRAALAAAVLLAACPAPAAAPVAPGAAPAASVAPTYATKVVALEPDAPTAIVAGPFAVTAINPGSDLALALVPGTACTADATWFGYSGGGVAVGRGETLCARSSAGATKVNAFSGHD